MREKFVSDFHDCLRKSGIDEGVFIEAIKYLAQEYEEKALRAKTNKDISERKMEKQES